MLSVENPTGCFRLEQKALRPGSIVVPFVAVSVGVGNDPSGERNIGSPMPTERLKAKGHKNPGWIQKNEQTMKGPCKHQSTENSDQKT